jgi:predicted nucleic acid-binding protein
MIRFAIDTGPLVALLNSRDAHHRWATETLDKIAPPLYTCEAVVSEACFLVRHLKGGPDAVLALISRSLILPAFRLDAELEAVRKLMAKYATVPMSLADACLVRLAELDRDLTIITLDENFRIYRRHGRQHVPTLMPE